MAGMVKMSGIPHHPEPNVAARGNPSEQRDPVTLPNPLRPHRHSYPRNSNVCACGHTKK